MNRYMIRVFAAVAVFFAIAPVYAQNSQTGSSDNDQIALFDAVSSINKGDLSKAHKILSGIISRNPDDDAAQYYMGMVRFTLGNFPGAEAAFKSAIQADPDNFWYRYRLGGLYAVTDRPELAISVYEELLDRYPDKYSIYYTLVELYLSDRQYDNALETLSQIEAVSGENELTAMARFDLMRVTGKADEGYSYLQEFNEIYPSPAICCILGDFSAGRYDDRQAIKMYDMALEMDNSYVPALMGKAGIYRMNGDFDNFFAYMRRFVTSPSVNAESLSRALEGIMQSSDANFLSAFRPKLDSLMDLAVDVMPADTLVNKAVGLYYYYTARTHRSLELFEKNLEMNPDSPQAWANCLDLLYYSQRWDKMDSLSVIASDRFSTEPYFVNMNAISSAMLKKYDRAAFQYKRLMELSPKDTSVRIMAYSVLGDICHETGDAKTGNKYYDKVLKLDPDNLAVMNNYAYFLSQDGKKLKKAYAMSKKCVEADPDNSTYLDTFGWILYLMDRSLEAKSFFKHAMIYGGRDSAVILDHYAEVLYDLGEYDLAMLYWHQAKTKNDMETDPDRKIADLDERISLRKSSK